MHAVILIDFGMTASAAECLIYRTQKDAHASSHHKFDKVPTQVAYGESGDVVAWGTETENHSTVRELFKTYLGMNTHGSTSDPSTSLVEVQKWTSDYLYRFCSYILDRVLCKEQISKEQLSTKWYFTTPGCWNEPARLNFKLLAVGALENFLPNPLVIADTTEAVASCEGATCDTAVAFMQKATGGNLIRHVFPIATKWSRNAGVEVVDDLFEKKIRIILQDSDHRDPSGLAQELRKSDAWPLARRAYDGTSDMTLTIPQDLGKWEFSAEGILIDHFKVTISSRTMKTFFVSFLDSLWKEIDESIKRLSNETPHHTRPGVIALCGGGGLMVYPLKQLRLRYQGIDITTCGSIEESRLATVVGHRMYRARLALDEFFNEIDIGLSSPSSQKYKLDSIEWSQKPGRVVNFEISSGKERTVQYFIVFRKDCPTPRPKSLGILMEHPWKWEKDILIWKLQVILDGHLFSKQKYCIEATCQEQDVFNFRAHNAGNADEALRLDCNTYYP